MNLEIISLLKAKPKYFKTGLIKFCNLKYVNIYLKKAKKENKMKENYFENPQKEIEVFVEDITNITEILRKVKKS